MDSFRGPLALFMGAMVGTGLWLIWVVVASLVLTPVVDKVRGSVSPTLGLIIGSIMLALVLLPSALLFSRLAGNVAGKMSPVPYMQRIAFYLSLMLDGIMVVILMVVAILNATPA